MRGKLKENNKMTMTKKKIIGVQFNASDVEKLQRLADRQDRSLSYIVRVIVLASLKDNEVD